MEFLNFTLDDQNIGLEWADGGYADLHNCFDFVELRYNPAAATLKLFWRKSTGKWAREVPWPGLHLLFEGVNYFHVKERDPEYPFSEDATVQHVCRTPFEAREEFENIYFNEDAQPEDDLLLYFQSKWGLKVNAATVSLQLEF
ncbi:hypothetical protein LGH70_23170 [Hymenobacter sp. BT635]|uniref:DUF4178 domain-containing protein n=1 Tax=Hymenobacter nitidus TaxID=2880929 RepID=A0ABS8ANF7_9BACT|nr:hypothetical protein [Hymenobacter nitidus]MCB2380514.1 hypothetical protein [Hymenobacter nitidus]